MKRGILLTGATGFLGSYALAHLLQTTSVRVFALLRADSDDHAIARLWEALQAHLPDEGAFWDVVPRIVRLRGSLHEPDLGLSARELDEVTEGADSVLHIAASLNRKSATACFNTNLRGTLHLLGVARRMLDSGGLARFTNVSTAAVAGKRTHEVVPEDEAIDWGRSDYDPYARTKKFAEELVRRTLPDDRVLTLRPSTVMGDSRHERCWITDMVRATCGLASLPVVPLDPDTRQDIVPGDWVGQGIARLHVRAEVAHRIYHLSAGQGAPTGRELSQALATSGRPLRFAPPLRRPFLLAMRGLDRLPRSGPQKVGAIMKVFWPYITNNVVFDNTRASAELGPPPPFAAILPGMVRYANAVGMRNPRTPLGARSPGG